MSIKPSYLIAGAAAAGLGIGVYFLTRPKAGAQEAFGQRAYGSDPLSKPPAPEFPWRSATWSFPNAAEGRGVKRGDIVKVSASYRTDVPTNAFSSLAEYDRSVWSSVSTATQHENVAYAEGTEAYDFVALKNATAEEAYIAMSFRANFVRDASGATDGQAITNYVDLSKPSGSFL